MAENRAVSVILTPEVREAVDRAAKDDGRTRSAYIARLLEKHLKEIKYLE